MCTFSWRNSALGRSIAIEHHRVRKYNLILILKLSKQPTIVLRPLLCCRTFSSVPWCVGSCKWMGQTARFELQSGDDGCGWSAHQVQCILYALALEVARSSFLCFCFRITLLCIFFFLHLSDLCYSSISSFSDFTLRFNVKDVLTGFILTPVIWILHLSPPHVLFRY